MACEAVHSGGRFLASTLSHLDCEGRTIGSYGFGALADPHSSFALALTAILTIFIALFGIRLLIDGHLDARGLVGDGVRVGLFLALATSWPAWKVIGYDLVLDAPSQIARSIGVAAGLPGNASDLGQRLQDADDGIVSLTMYGSGRLTGGIAAGADLGDSESGVALPDQSALGLGRTVFLATAIGTSGLLSLGAGILLAIAPVMAGLVLFGGALPLFFGWIRGLAFCALSSLGFRVINGAELALIYPWLSDVLAQRQNNTLTPSAPTELLVLASGFAIMTMGLLFLFARVTFLPALFARRVSAPFSQPHAVSGYSTSPVGRADIARAPERAVEISNAIAQSIRREESNAALGGQIRAATLDRGADRHSDAGAVVGQGERLGTHFRSDPRRTSASSRSRDRA